MADVAALGLEVRSDQVEHGAKSLDNLTNSAKRAEAAAEGVSAATRNAGAAATSLAAQTGQVSAGLNKQAVAAQRAAVAMRAGNDNARRMSGSFSGLAAQFQDIGVTAAAGMNPAIIGLQQGTQIAGQMEMAMQGGQSAVGALGAAFKSLLSPLTFITIGMTALAAVGLQMVNWPKLAASALNGLADVLSSVAPYAVGAAAALALIYAPAILAGLAMVSEAILGITARLVGLAVGFALANPATAFVAGIIAAVAAANIFRDELTQIFGRDIVADAKSAVNFVIGAFVGGFRAIKATWSALPAAIGDLVYQAADFTVRGVESMVNAVIDKINSFVGGAYNALSGLASKVGIDIGTFKNIGHVDLGGVSNPHAGAAASALGTAQDAVSSAMNTDYVGLTYDAIAKGASAASSKLKELAKDITTVDDKSKKKKGGGGKTDAEKYSDIVDGANRRIAALKAEQAGLGMTEEQALKLKYTQDLLNQAQQKGITLTAAQKAELAGLAGQMASTEVATKKAKEALDFAKDATKGFLDDLRQGLENGEGFWKSFGNAALGVLDKIIDKIETDLINALFDVKSAGGGGGGLGGLIMSGVNALFGLGGGGGQPPVIGGDPWLGWRATGGPVTAGHPYIVGEKRPELFVPGQSGMIVPSVPKMFAANDRAANQNSRVQIDVAVHVNDDGTLGVIARQAGGQAADVRIQQYDKQMPARVKQINDDPRAR